MNSIDKLTEHFLRFPGIGHRQARRFAYFLLSKDPSFLEDLSLALIELRENTLQCSSCFRFYQKYAVDDALCPECADPSRDQGSLLVVERDVDLDNFRKTDVFGGLFFVLGGSVPVLEKEPSKRVRSRELFSAVQERAKAGVLREIILGMNTTTEGENTAEYLTSILAPLAERYSLTITTLGRGLSSGAEVEYSDRDTLQNALKNRR